MAKGFKHGAGGGSSLNFKVVGNPQPANAKENTIWINTDDKITGWDFTLVEPSAPTEGMIWVCTNFYSITPFNALKKNSLMVYPVLAKQYLGGLWLVKEAMIYQGGTWKAWWDGTLYDSGKQYEAFTGGITSWKCVQANKGSVSFGTDRITLSANYGMGVSVGPGKLIDLTDFTTLSVNVLSITGGHPFALRIGAKDGLNDESMGCAYKDITSVGETHMDITNLKGMYQPSVSNYGFYQTDMTLSFNRLKLS